jgi:hypothetical protein
LSIWLNRYALSDSIGHNVEALAFVAVIELLRPGTNVD